MKILAYLVGFGLMAQTASATFPFCPTLKSTASLPAFTNWKVLEVSPTRQPPIPSNLQTLCKNTCLVLQSGEYSYWSYSYKDQQSGFVIIAYNRDNQIVQRWEMNGFLSTLEEITINPLARWIHFNGENNQQIIVNWQELTFYQFSSKKTITEQQVSSKIPQHINFTLPSSLTIGESPLNLITNGGNSGNKIIFENQTPTICALKDSTLTPLNAGECVIVANQEGNQDFAAASPVKQSVLIKSKPISPPITNNNAAPSNLCLNVTGAYSFESKNGRAGYCNDYFSSSSTVPCLVALQGDLNVGTCSTIALTPKPNPLMSLSFLKAFIGSSFSAGKPRCDASTSYLETSTTKAPSAMSFVCFKYEREIPSSYYYGVALINNGQILSYQLETTPDKCVGNCP
jgi:hypothetical protein